MNQNDTLDKEDKDLTPDRQQILDKLKPVIASKAEIKFAYLFGSVATGSAGRLSDIDIAVYLDTTCQLPEAGYGYKSELISELSALMSTSVDVVILNTAKTLMRYQVIKNGILIYSRSNAERRAFLERTIRDYLDLKPLLKVQREYLRKRLLTGSFGLSSG